LCMAAVIGALLVLTGYRTQNSAAVPDPSEAIYRSKVFVNPQNETSTVGESATAVGERARDQALRSEPVVLPEFLPPDTRLLVPGEDIALTDSSSMFLPNNLVVFQTRFKNITDNLHFHQPFFFTLSVDADTANIVNLKAPLITDGDLGGNGVLTPGEETALLSFEVIHKGEPFSFFVNAHAVVKVVEIPAELIVTTGHGKFFDKDMNEVKLDASLIILIQESMIDEILKESPTDLDPAVEEAQELLDSQTLTIDETILVQSGMIGKLLQEAPEELITRFGWLNTALSSHWLSLHPDLIEQLRPEIRDLLERLDFFKPPEIPDTDYIAKCRAQRVPIPPNWDESGEKWKFQGQLTQNLLKGQPLLNPPEEVAKLLKPGQVNFAGVWTFFDPNVKGACIALPRASGAPGPESVAGIICQSAETGHACFWDNILRDADTPNIEETIGWKDKTLEISKLKDGSNLQGSTGFCPQCHRGNNVFLISPDDPTWAKVLRGPLEGGPSGGKFTTQVETSTDIQGGHPRYIPIAQPGEEWQNTFSGNCAGGCHEIPPSSFATPQPMVPPPMLGPLCAKSPTDPSTCYGTP
jgi:hypothetical protein